jgi:hypothetical protein
MPDKPVFSEQAEQFAAVVHALLQDKETRTAFAKAPLATLKQHGIEFKDPAVAKKVEAQLGTFVGGLSDDDICPPIQFAMASARISSATQTQTAIYSWTRTGPVVRATNVTWVVKPEGIDDVIQVNQPRVDAFVTKVSMESTLAMRDAKIAQQAARIAELEASLANMTKR